MIFRRLATRAPAERTHGRRVTGLVSNASSDGSDRAARFRMEKKIAAQLENEAAKAEAIA